MEEDWPARARAWRPRRTVFVSERGWEAFSGFKAGITGRKGERAVTRELERLGVPALHDVILQDEHGITQIDHLVLGKRSIAVLETKTYAGRITGALDAPEWSQHLRGGEQRYPMFNPVLQNERHMRAVAAQFASSPPRLSGFVVTAGTATFEGAIAAVIVPLACLAEVLDAASADAPPSDALPVAWQMLRSAACRGEALRAEHNRALMARASRLGGRDVQVVAEAHAVENVGDGDLDVDLGHHERVAEGE